MIHSGKIILKIQLDRILMTNFIIENTIYVGTIKIIHDGNWRPKHGVESFTHD